MQNLIGSFTVWRFAQYTKKLEASPGPGLKES